MVDIGSGMPQIYIFPAHWYVHPLVINWMFSGSHLVKVFYLVIAMLDLFNSAIDHNVQYICRQWSISPVACKNKAWFKKLFGPGNTKEGMEMNILINFFSNAVWKLLEITLFLCVCISSCSWSDVQSAGWKTWNSKTCRHVAFASALNDKDKYLLFENLIHYLIWFCRHFMYANASNSFQHLISAYPGPLMLVSILVRALFWFLHLFPL